MITSVVIKTNDQTFQDQDYGVLFKSKTKTKTKTGRFGLETTRDQDHGLEDNNTDDDTIM